MNELPHIPVLLEEVLEQLAPQDGGIYVDGTLGAGGYARAVLEVADCQVIGIDRDPLAHELASDWAPAFHDRFMSFASTFGSMEALLAAQGISEVDGVMLDIGVSSMQLDRPERGFSFMQEGPLDMRMSGEGKTAADLVNTLPERELADLIYLYGEERRSRRIARRIVAQRRSKPFATTWELANLLESALPRPKPYELHPATRTFQALRIAVNDELGELERGLVAAERLLVPGGVLVVVTFHSLEDRLVKRFMQQRAGRAVASSRHAPAPMEAPPASLELMTRKPVTPSPEEIERNPRARSAKLRAARCLAVPASMEVE